MTTLKQQADKIVAAIDALDETPLGEVDKALNHIAGDMLTLSHRVDLLERDAARYRWLRGRSTEDFHDIGLTGIHDATVDAAMKDFT